MSTTHPLVIIVAAGSGQRFGSLIPKQFCDLNGRPVLMSTIDAFRHSLPEAHIVLVISEPMHPLWDELCQRHSFETPEIVYGGDTRLQSVYNALYACSSLAPETPTLIHDGARPLVTGDIIRDAATIPDGYDGCVPVIAVSDSLRQLTADGHSKSVDRSRYVAVQTPQSARLATLLDAYSRPTAPIMTDDASVLEHAGYTRLRLIEGDPRNIKITNPGDIAVAETFTAGNHI